MSFSNRNENAQVRPASKTMKKRETLVAELKFNPDSVIDDCVIADLYLITQKLEAMRNMKYSTAAMP
jgi:tRNA nucleotidyltransferase (CCA-adding enzyme)